jgi:hypothetical protein
MKKLTHVSQLNLENMIEGAYAEYRRAVSSYLKQLSAVSIDTLSLLLQRSNISSLFGASSTLARSLEEYKSLPTPSTAYV